MYAHLASHCDTVLCADANTYPDKWEEQTAWKALRSLPGVHCCWDDYYDPFGRPLRPPASMPVTSNKMRGPLSDQPKKIGEHVYHTVDHIFCSVQLEFKKMALKPLVLGGKAKAALHLLPSFGIPSDHVPVVADFTFVSRAAEKAESIGGASTSRRSSLL